MQAGDAHTPGQAVTISDLARPRVDPGSDRSTAPMPAARPLPRSGPVRLVAVDGMRFIAALSVVAYHYTFYGRENWLAGHAPAVDAITRYGLFGVNLFFIISGFVICMSSWGRGLGDFFVSRTTRLFPAFWVAVLLTVGVTYLLGRHHLDAGGTLANLTMFAEPLGFELADGSYWTLWRELLFYLLFAIVVWHGVTYRRVMLFCVLWTVASILVAARPDGALASVIDPEFSMYFIAGMAMYLMYRFRPTPMLWGIVGLSWLLSMQSLRGGEARVELSGPSWRWWVGAGVVTACFLLMLLAALGWLEWIRWRFVTLLGALTYPLYLIHQVIGYEIIRRLDGRINATALLSGLVAIMLLLAWFIYRLVERPLAPLMRRALRAALAEARERGPGRVGA